VRPFTRLTSIAAALPMINVDTDMIIPKQFLKTIKREGLGRYLFHDLRYAPNGAENSGFVLNQSRYRQAQILITGTNFGCGSSREHAVWALADFGIRCVMAPSFADIFSNNCAKNGVLALNLPQHQLDRCLAMAQAARPLTVDLADQYVAMGRDGGFAFTVDNALRHQLLSGLDDIGLTEEHMDAIDAHERRSAIEFPWLWCQ